VATLLLLSLLTLLSALLLIGAVKTSKQLIRGLFEQQVVELRQQTNSPTSRSAPQQPLPFAPYQQELGNVLGHCQLFR